MERQYQDNAAAELVFEAKLSFVIFFPLPANHFCIVINSIFLSFLKKITIINRTHLCLSAGGSVSEKKEATKKHNDIQTRKENILGEFHAVKSPQIYTFYPVKLMQNPPAQGLDFENLGRSGVP